MSNARKTLDKHMTEAQLMDYAIETALTFGWLVMHIPDRLYSMAAKQGRYDALPGAGGFPDLVLCHPEAGRLIFAELKTEQGRLSSEQREWIEAIDSVWDRFVDSSGMAFPPRVTAVVWRPRDRSSGLIERTLQVL